MALDLSVSGRSPTMAPLVGVNRRAAATGCRACICSGLAGLQAHATPGWAWGTPPRCNAWAFQLARSDQCGWRWGPQLVWWSLLHPPADDETGHGGLAQEVRSAHRQRRELCVRSRPKRWPGEGGRPGSGPVSAAGQSHWHHGVIGGGVPPLVERVRPCRGSAGPSEGNGTLATSVRAAAGLCLLDQALQPLPRRCWSAMAVTRRPVASPCGAGGTWRRWHQALQWGFGM